MFSVVQNRNKRGKFLISTKKQIIVFMLSQIKLDYIKYIRSGTF